MVVSLPYLGELYHRIRRLAKRHDITVVPKTSCNIRSELGTPKAPLPKDQRSGLMYWVPCSCGQFYIGQTGREVATRIKEHSDKWRLHSGAFKDHRSVIPGPLHAPKFEEYEILGFENNKDIREIKESFLILQGGQSAMPNTNRGHSGVNRNVGLQLSEGWQVLTSKLRSLPDSIPLL